MDTAMFIEIFGYIGSALVVIAMLMSSIVKLRVINTIGCVISGIYAIICGAFPLVLMNGCLIIINIYNLFKLLKNEKEYDVVEAKADDATVGYFLKRYASDIKTYFPDYNEEKAADKIYLSYCNGTPAGLFLGKDKGNGTVDVIIDYSTPMYRDCSVGIHLYSQLPLKGVNKLLFSQKETATHAAYMSKMGYIKESGINVKKIG